METVDFQGVKYSIPTRLTGEFNRLTGILVDKYITEDEDNFSLFYTTFGPYVQA